jgi:acyl transferase domain-containing protein
VFDDQVAIIGMAVKVPGADDLDRFWANLARGRESITPLPESQLRDAGVPDELLTDPHYVRAGALLDAPDAFDAGLFGMTPREAAVCDPQIRLFLQTAHGALDNAGYDPFAMPGSVGVFAAAGANRYAELNLRQRAELAGSSQLGLHTLNQSDYVATTAAYRLNLRGPSITVLTACSSALVGLHLACQALRAGDCDTALVGASDLEFPVGHGYLWASGGVLSSDGHCRPFDKDATGTVFGSGVAAVLLKPLADAERDGDRIRAVVLASTVNNDGADKVSFSAPSVAGQSAVVMEAIGLAGLDARDISYVEAHGTGTALGDRIEVTSLTEAFTALAEEPLDPGGCVLGSVKGNVGHLGPVAGLAGLVKTVLSLEHEQIPPTINVTTPNPSLASTPFALADGLRAWPRRADRPRYAGVSSLGIGGTNAHVVLGEAPARRPRPVTDLPRLVVWSGRDDEACRAVQERLACWFTETGEGEFTDAVATLQHGRTAYAVRGAAVCRGAVDAAAALRDPERVVSDPSPGLVLPAVADLDAARELARTVPAIGTALHDWPSRCGDHGDGVRDAWQGTATPDDAVRGLLGLGVALAIGESWVAAGADPTEISGGGAGALAAECLAGKQTRAQAIAAVIAGRPVEPPPDGAAAGLKTYLDGLARLWVSGRTVDWTAAGCPAPEYRAALPGYPYRRDRHWIAPPAPASRVEAADSGGVRVSLWRDATADPVAAPARFARVLLVVPRGEEVALPLTAALQQAGARVTRFAWSRTRSLRGRQFSGQADDPDQVRWALDQMASWGEPPDLVVLATGMAAASGDWSAATYALNSGVAAQAAVAPVPLLVCTTGGADVSGSDRVTTMALATATVGAAHLDLDATVPAEAIRAALEHLVPGARMALRGRRRWVPTEAPLAAAPSGAPALRPGGTHLVVDRRGAGALDLARAVAEDGLRATLAVVTAADEPIRGDLDRVADIGPDITVLAWSPPDASGLPGVLAEALAASRTPSSFVMFDGPDRAGTPRDAVDVTDALAAGLSGVDLDLAAFVWSGPAGAAGPLATIWRCAGRVSGLTADRVLSVHDTVPGAAGGPSPGIGRRLLDLVAAGVSDHVVLGR